VSGSHFLFEDVWVQCLNWRSEDERVAQDDSKSIHRLT
jgi:hypothetical protein